MAYPLKANILTFSMFIRLVTVEVDKCWHDTKNIIDDTSYIVFEKVDRMLVLTTFKPRINP